MCVLIVMKSQSIAEGNFMVFSLFVDLLSFPSMQGNVFLKNWMGRFSVMTYCLRTYLGI